MFDSLRNMFKPKPEAGSAQARIDARIQHGERIQAEGKKLLADAEQQSQSPEAILSAEIKSLNAQYDAAELALEKLRLKMRNPYGERMTTEQAQDPMYIAKRVEELRKQASEYEQEMIRVMGIKQVLSQLRETLAQEQHVSPEILQIITFLEKDAAQNLARFQQSSPEYKAPYVARLKGLSDLRVILEKK